MDTMAALFEAMSSTPAAGELSPAAPPILADRHALPRLSFAPPMAETPEPATTLAAGGAGALGLSAIGRLEYPLQAVPTREILGIHPPLCSWTGGEGPP